MSAPGNAPPSNEQGLNLTDAEAMSLARRVVAYHLGTDWLLWEDYPLLGEHAFQRLVDAVDAMTKDAHQLADECDLDEGIDSQFILERATE